MWFESDCSEKFQAAERTAMESATSIATEAIVSVRTVQGLGKLYWLLSCQKYKKNVKIHTYYTLFYA